MTCLSVSVKAICKLLSSLSYVALRLIWAIPPCYDLTILLIHFSYSLLHVHHESTSEEAKKRKLSPVFSEAWRVGRLAQRSWLPLKGPRWATNWSMAEPLHFHLTPGTLPSWLMWEGFQTKPANWWTTYHTCNKLGGRCYFIVTIYSSMISTFSYCKKAMIICRKSQCSFKRK